MARWVLIALVVLGLAAGGVWAGHQRSRVVVPAETVPGDRLFGEVFSRIRSSAVDPMNDEEIYRRAAQGVIGELDDPYAVLRFPGQSAAPVPDRPTAQGLFLDRRDGLAIVVTTVPGSPAEQGGIRAGDYLGA